VRITGKGQITIPPEMRKRHGLVARAEIVLVDQPDGVLITKVSKLSRGRRAVSALLHGGKVKGRTEDWLRLTRGEA
jgi:bifunctional DNA-binding transcriptional regulator/antitoxin component of YhaV-PrlF toxin-antitoxin module